MTRWERGRLRPPRREAPIMTFALRANAGEDARAPRKIGGLLWMALLGYREVMTTAARDSA